MCNCKGYDIAYYGDTVSIEQHFCRTYGDCGHECTLEQASVWCAQFWESRSNEALSQSQLYRSMKHDDVLFYLEQKIENQPILSKELKVAAAMWKAEVLDSGSPHSVYLNRTPELFLEQDERLKEKWMKLAVAAIESLE